MPAGDSSLKALVTRRRASLELLRRCVAEQTLTEEQVAEVAEEILAKTRDIDLRLAPQFVSMTQFPDEMLDH